MNSIAEKESTKSKVVPYGRPVAPDVNIYETKDGYVLEADMPGVAPEGLEITVESGTLAIAGERQDVAPGILTDGETRSSRYHRVFELDPQIDTARINGRLNDGLLTLTLPKAEAAKPRKIEVR